MASLQQRGHHSFGKSPDGLQVGSFIALPFALLTCPLHQCPQRPQKLLGSRFPGASAVFSNLGPSSTSRSSPWPRTLGVQSPATFDTPKRTQRAGRAVPRGFPVEASRISWRLLGALKSRKSRVPAQHSIRGVSASKLSVFLLAPTSERERERERASGPYRSSRAC